jgi:hypothetical protein
MKREIEPKFRYFDQVFSFNSLELGMAQWKVLD